MLIWALLYKMKTFLEKESSLLLFLMEVIQLRQQSDLFSNSNLNHWFNLCFNQLFSQIHKMLNKLQS